MSGDGPELQYNLKIDAKGPYVLVLEYVTPTRLELRNLTGTVPTGLSVRHTSADNREAVATININNCRYTTPCRQVFVDDLSRVKVFHFDGENSDIYLRVSKVLILLKMINHFTKVVDLQVILISRLQITF